MTREELQTEGSDKVEIIEQLENAIELIKQDGKDWLDDRDIPILEACIESLMALDKIRAEIEPLTDIEQRTFLAAMSREEKVCKEVFHGDGKDLVKVCHNVERKVKKALWN